ncbi:MAG: hypothetical protein K5888_02115 [Lachnospiraceae bacterium]|nr:hypothetical protein [Lachnospiraceae bacterium]
MAREYDYDEGYSEEELRREFRRKRRIRNRAIAVIAAVIIVVALAAGGFFGIHYVLSSLSERKQEQEAIIQEGEQPSEQISVEAPENE